MEDFIKNLKIGYYWDLALRHRWLIIMLFSIFMIAGIYFSITLPRIYAARTLILVVPKSVPDKYVPSVTDEDVSERITTISQQIKSRTNLEKIIEEHKLFAGNEYANMFLEDKLGYLRQNIGVDVTKSRKGIDSFTISFHGEEPEKVRDVVNSLATSFIDASLKIMTAEVIGTSKFLESVLQLKANNLDTVNHAIQDYRENHMGELPEQLSTNLKNLDRLQEKQLAKQESLRDAKERLGQLEKDMADIQTKIQEEIRKQKARASQLVSEKAVKASEALLKLQQLQEQYAAMTARYTEQHPDVIKLKYIIEEFQKKIRQQPDTNKDIALSENDPLGPVVYKEAMPEAGEGIDRLKQIEEDMRQLEGMKFVEDIEKLEDMRQRYKEMRRQREDIQREISIHQEDIVKIVEDVKIFEKRVENTPKRELELASLERKFKPIQLSYESLLSKQEDAMIAVEMEMKQKGQKFRIVDPAQTPQKPISPDMKKLLLIFVGVGIGSGLGLTFLLDVLDKSLRRPEDVEMIFDVPMLGTIPKIYSQKDLSVRKIKNIMSIFAVMAAFFLFAVFVVFSLKGVERTLEFVTNLIH